MSECDFIDECIAEFGDSYVNDLLDKGFVPAYLSGKGWMWVMPAKALNRVLS